MTRSRYSLISGTGSYIPPRRIPNASFASLRFLDSDGACLPTPSEEVVEGLEKITTIKERRYIDDNWVASDIGYFAAKDALESSGVDPESLDYIIVAHNFGDVRVGNPRSDFVPNLAARVKHKLKIKNPGTVAYDIAFGCPGWVQGVIQADYFLRSGDATRVMVIGVETLSRVSDPFDRNSMLFADGGGAVILEGVEREEPAGILAHATRTDTVSQAYFLWMAESYDKARQDGSLFLKMNGRRLYKYALENVPVLVKQCIERAGMDIREISKVLMHQANAKMNEAIVGRLFQLCGVEDAPTDLVMPMTISWLGNSSVATVPTLLDLVAKGKMLNHQVGSGENIVLCAVGAGMNINAIVYRFP